MIPPCPGSGNRPIRINERDASGECPNCNVRFPFHQLSPFRSSYTALAGGTDRLVPPHSPGSHHQEL